MPLPFGSGRKERRCCGPISWPTSARPRPSCAHGMPPTQGRCRLHPRHDDPAGPPSRKTPQPGTRASSGSTERSDSRGSASSHPLPEGDEGHVTFHARRKRSGRFVSGTGRFTRTGGAGTTTPVSASPGPPLRRFPSSALSRGPFSALDCTDGVRPPQFPAGREQAVHPDRTPRMDASGRDSDLGAQPEAVAIGEPGRRVVETQAASTLRGRPRQNRHPPSRWPRYGGRADGCAQWRPQPVQGRSSRPGRCVRGTARPRPGARQ